MTVRELRMLADDCWVTLVDNVNHDENGEPIIIWDESKNGAVPKDYLDLTVRWFTPALHYLECFVTV